MKPTRAILVAAAVLAIGFSVIGFIAAGARSDIEAQVAEADQRGRKMRAELQRLARATTGRPHLANPPAAGASASKPAAAATPAFPPRSRPPGLLDFARNNPQLWNEFVQSKRAELGRLYLPVQQRLNLSASDRERLKDILAADIARSSDIGAAADAKGLRHDDPAIVALREQSAQQLKRELAALLGPAGFREFDAYERALPVRGYVDGLAVQLAAIAPISGQQADALERALADANEPYRKGDRADPKALDWGVADRKAREILSPAQFAVWQRGVAHNMFGGSRRAQELERVYEQAVARTKARAGSASR